MDELFQSEQNCCQCKYHTPWADGQNNTAYLKKNFKKGLFSDNILLELGDPGTTY